MQRMRQGGRKVSLSPSSMLPGPYACYTNGVHVFPSITDAGTGDLESSQVNGVLVPPTAVRFAPGPVGAGVGGDLVAVADEDGTVTIVGASEAPDGEPSREWWLAHNNAIFDLVWSHQGDAILTASGDQNAKLWDVESGLCRASFLGHASSVKSVSFAHNSPDLFVSSARDGAIMLWDARVRGAAGPVGAIHAAHVRPTYKGSRRYRSLEVNHSVTAARFAPADNAVFSSGALDGLLKVWDIRTLSCPSPSSSSTSSSSSSTSSPSSQTSPNGKRGRLPLVAIHPGAFDPPPSDPRVLTDSAAPRNGLVTLDISPHGDSLLVSQVTSSSIYVYSVVDLLSAPASATPRVLQGHQTRTFYVKSVFAGVSGNMVLSGSSDGMLYLWDLAASASGPSLLSQDPLLPFFAVEGHLAETSAVDASNISPFRIASGSDDNSVRIWDLAPRPLSAMDPDLLDVTGSSGFATAAAQRDDVSPPPTQPNSPTPPLSRTTSRGAVSHSPSPAQMEITHFFARRPPPAPPSPSPPPSRPSSATSVITSFFKPVTSAPPPPPTAPTTTATTSTTTSTKMETLGFSSDVSSPPYTTSSQIPPTQTTPIKPRRTQSFLERRFSPLGLSPSSSSPAPSLLHPPSLFKRPLSSSNTNTNTTTTTTTTPTLGASRQAIIFSPLDLPLDDALDP